MSFAQARQATLDCVQMMQAISQSTIDMFLDMVNDGVNPVAQTVTDAAAKSLGREKANRAALKRMVTLEESCASVKVNQVVLRFNYFKLSWLTESLSPCCRVYPRRLSKSRRSGSLRFPLSCK